MGKCNYNDIRRIILASHIKPRIFKHRVDDNTSVVLNGRHGNVLPLCKSIKKRHSAKRNQATFYRLGKERHLKGCFFIGFFMKNCEAKKMMIKKYGKRCWLGGNVTKQDPLTYHHIIKKCEKGKANEENGALITRSRHDLLNILEQWNPEIYHLLNDLFQLYKIELDDEMIEQMEEILFEGLEKAKVKKKVVFYG